MKKLLIASTALVATAGIAAADGHLGVAVGGDGRMGITYNDSAADEVQFSSRIRISFTASGETDGGLTFGGSVRADNSGGGAAGTAGSVYMGGEGWKLSMGDVGSAAESATGDLHGVGYTGAGDANEFTYLGNDLTAAELSLTFGGASVGISAGQLGSDDFAVGLSYSFGDITVAAGYEDNGAVDHTTVAISGSFGDIDVKAMYGDATGVGDGDQYGVSMSGSFGGVGVSAYYREDFAGGDNMGLGFSYGLGGGATLKGGVADLDGTTAADLGVTFSF